MTEGHAAIHAARGLVAQALVLHVMVELLPIAHALERRPIDGQLAQILDESGGFSHVL